MTRNYEHISTMWKRRSSAITKSILRNTRNYERFSTTSCRRWCLKSLAMSTITRSNTSRITTSIKIKSSTSHSLFQDLLALARYIDILSHSHFNIYYLHINPNYALSFSLNDCFYFTSSCSRINGWFLAELASLNWFNFYENMVVSLSLTLSKIRISLNFDLTNQSINPLWPSFFVTT